MNKARWGKAALSILMVFILSSLLLYVFKDEYPHIKSCLSSLSVSSVLFLLCLGVLYNLLDAKAEQILVCQTIPAFSFAEAMELAYLGLFANIAAFVAALPIQSYYLCRKGEKAGNAIGKLLVLRLGGSRVQIQLGRGNSRTGRRLPAKSEIRCPPACRDAPAPD